MTRTMAAFVYFALYCVVALLPLQVALVSDPHAQPRGFLIELGTAFGLVGFSLILLELALVTRIRTLSDSFGSDTLLQLHRGFALVAATLVLVHTLVLAPSWGGWSALNPFSANGAQNSGALAFWALTLLILTSGGRRQLRLPYNGWRLIHRSSSVALLLAACTHVLMVSGYSASPALRNLVLLLTLGFGGLLFNYLLIRPLRLWRKPWRVTANTDLGADTRLLAIEAQGHAGFRFEPGQFAWLITGRNPYSREQHPVTIASSAEVIGSDCGQSYAIKDLGDWSGKRVPALAPGARLWVEGPYGALSVDRMPAQGFVLIAGGIGITPMRSILLTLRDRGDARPCVLFYAVNDFSRMVFREELQQLRSQMNLTLVFVLEHPEPGDVCERGRITKAMLERYLPAQRQHFQFLICGPNPMMDIMEHLLFELGIPDDRVHSERFNQV